jgi:hypothetical protein
LIGGLALEVLMKYDNFSPFEWIILIGMSIVRSCFGFILELLALAASLHPLPFHLNLTKEGILPNIGHPLKELARNFLLRLPHNINFLRRSRIIKLLNILDDISGCGAFTL